ncbi:hypothetical protein TRFO_08621 [Tritrichomonas foetus]|uniref:Uncharacterized protein n=1 Tax=Tritrichomonas foetus TaxID=1144522 RepID=A0A1J4JKW6_9EUKA|nr:hypothetical protein TRFO_08621 [Tritrichomonas foetus]|eukprot:OHS99055.1 hypothetical protein TRFO_08621 [Tritrichomonas foetus]
MNLAASIQLDKVALDKSLYSIIRNDDAKGLEEFCKPYQNPIIVECPKNGPKILQDNPSLLSIAAFYGSEKCVDFLLNSNTRVSIADSAGRTPSHFAAAANKVAILDKLNSHKHPIRICLPDSHECSISHYAALHDHVDVLKWCLQNNIPIDIPSKLGSPIHYACKAKSKNVIQYLANLNIEAKKANPSLDSSNFPINMNRLVGKFTPLNILLDNQFYEPIPKLIEAGLDLNAPLYHNWPIIFYAVRGKFSQVQFLVDQKCEVNQRAANGWTPMHVAAQERNIQAVKIFLEKGADPHTLTMNKSSPFSLAAGFSPKDRKAETAQLIKEAVAAKIARMIVQKKLEQLKKAKKK